MKKPRFSPTATDSFEAARTLHEQHRSEAMATAMAAIERLSQSGATFTVDDVRRAVDSQIPDDIDRRVYGSALRAAAALGVIQRVDFSQTEVRTSHGRPVVVWAGLPPVAA